MSSPNTPAFACPRCHDELLAVSASLVRCPKDDLAFGLEDGIWRFLLPERVEHFHRFVEEYQTVRRAEGWGGDTAAYYRDLPCVAGPHADIWRIRAQSYRALLAGVVQPAAETLKRPLHILDVGAGNGWLAHRLAGAGHGVVAVDLVTNRVDGLGARTFYDVDFTAVQAEFDRLPFAGGQADLIVFNGAFHYSTGYEVTLHEALRVLAPNGELVIMDSPIYRDEGSARQMVRERQQQFERSFGVRGDALPNENYLTWDRLAALATSTGVGWRTIAPSYGWRWALRPWLARLRRHREPATFCLVVGRVAERGR